MITNKIVKAVEKIEDMLSVKNVCAEEKNLVRFIKSLRLSVSHKILDVGCGYGNKMKLLQSLGLEVIGVEVNHKIVEENKKNGLNCMAVEDFRKSDEMFDLVLMSHIIEHFYPKELIKFMDTYLDRLKSGGYLIILTPLNSPYFYNDFDHVKPYQPCGINMVFGKGNAQVQYYSRNKIELQDIWFRREPFRQIFFAGLYIRKPFLVATLVNCGLVLLYYLSWGLIAQTNGWIGLYRKLSN